VPRIAILGSNGFLGKPIATAFEVKNWEVFSLNRTLSSNPQSKNLFADLFDENSLEIALRNLKPNVVVSTAWDTEHGKFWTNESNNRYKDATLRFAEMSFEYGVETFIGLGTMSEYGTSPGRCNNVFTPVSPTNIYSKSKIETGLQLFQIGNKYGKKTHWARIFQAFGPNEKNERFIPSLLQRLSRNESISIRTPNFRMDWIHTEDIASAIVFTLENELDHFVDIGTSVGTTVRELSELICQEFNFDKSLLDYADQELGHEKTAIVDTDTQLLAQGWKPAESLSRRVRSLR
jgi:nucleoside-diphosphate-sugar epimerase